MFDPNDPLYRPSTALGQIIKTITFELSIGPNHRPAEVKVPKDLTVEEAISLIEDILEISRRLHEGAPLPGGIIKL